LRAKGKHITDKDSVTEW